MKLIAKLNACTALLFICGASNALAQTYTTFDPPGSTLTQVCGINNNGAIAGNYNDSNNVSHGFVRAGDGAITTFDPPGSINIQPGELHCINQGGAIVGFYQDSNNVLHGYVRAVDGTFTTFDPSGSINTQAYGINDEGWVTGTYLDGSGVWHGFVRNPMQVNTRERIVSFDGAGGAFVTEGFAINDGGEIGGWLEDSTGFWPAFVRAKDGTITSFDVGGNYTFVNALNNQGVAIGTYLADGWNSYVRAVDGTITPFDVPVGVSGTFAVGINNNGTITGPCTLGGFVRTADGQVTTFTVPGATGTNPRGINDLGLIAGDYQDANGVVHGFLRTP